MLRKERSDGERTRQRLLEAACEVFGEKGYREATVAEICRRAGANVAAVNYHFGSKEELYRAAWRHSFRKGMEAYPPDGGVPRGATAEERLRGRIRAFLERILRPGAVEFRIMFREIGNPTGLLDEIVQEDIRPHREAMQALVRELLGEEASPEVVRLCSMSIIAQCTGFAQRLLGRAVLGTRSVGWTPQVLADHITRFSLAGIRGLAVKGRQPRGGGHRGARGGSR